MRKLLALFCVLAACPALAQPLPVETVTVDAYPLPGVWRVSRPDFIVIQDAASPPTLGPLRESFCRIAPPEDGRAMYCSGLEAATVTVEGGDVAFTWGTAPSRMILVGELENEDRFRGRFRFELSGRTHEIAAVSEGALVIPELNAADTGGKTELLRRILTRGLAGVRRDTAAIRTWPEPPQLGAVTAITYLGQHAGGHTAQPGAFSVYLVAFGQAERICELRQRDDGALDGFGCF